MLRVLLEALVIGLKIYWAAQRAGKAEVVSGIKKDLDELSRVPTTDLDRRLAISASISRKLREL